MTACASNIRLVFAAALPLLCLSPAAAASAHPTYAVTVKGGSMAPDGVAKLSGHLPAGASFTPASFALSTDATFGTTDLVLGASPPHGSGGTFQAWVSLPDVTTPGAYQLLACKRAVPSAGTCKATGAVTVKAPPTIPLATAALDKAHRVSTFMTSQGGSASVTTADGTKLTLTVLANAVPNLPVTLTQVTSLSPAGAAGSLITGVMITPLGSAPPGTTLEIHRSSLPKGARLVAFGGMDPSGGAFPLPLKLKADVKIPITSFGGYGITVPTTGTQHARTVKAVPCQRAHPAAAGSRPLMSCIAVAERMRQMSDAVSQSIEAGNTVDVGEIFEAAERDLATETNRITSQTPSEEGAAELELITTLVIGVERQAALMGVQTSQGTKLLIAPLQYQGRLIKSICTGAAKRSSDIYIDYFYRALFLDRQLQLLGFEEGGSGSLESACAKRILLELDGNGDGTVDNGQWTGHVVANAAETIKGTAQLRLEGSLPTLTFTVAKAKADPSFAAQGGSAVVKSKSGDMDGGSFQIAATRHVRCDKNRRLVVDRKAFLYVIPDSVWNDAETVQLSQNGSPIVEEPQAALSLAFANDYNAPKQQHMLEINGDSWDTSNSGKCDFGFECQTFAYTVSLAAKALEN